MCVLATINNPKLLPYGAWQTPDSFIFHDRKYRPLVRLAAHEDQDEPSEALGNVDLPGGIDCHARGGVPSFIRVRPETAQVVDPSEWIEHEEGWAYWFEPDLVRLQDLVNSIPELGAEIQRRDAADIAAKKAEREAFEQHAEANARYHARVASIQAKPPLQVTESDLRELPILERLQLESKIMMERHNAAKVTPLLPGTPVPSNVAALRNAPVSLMSRGESLPADSEDSLALDFAGLHADDLRYVEEWGRWMHWSGQAWTPDKTSSAYNLIREHLRKFAGGLAYQDARKVATAKTVAAVERMARTDRRIVTTGDIWDADTMLLNTPGGVVDLRTGRVRPAQPSDHMTKLTAVAPGGDCPTWRAFLAKSLAGDADLIAFIQRVLGYALTGDTREHALFFMYGQGGNGKGVLLNTVAGIIGDYQKTAPVETFIDSPHDRHPTDLASLRGARLVTASETEKGRRWAEAKIKMLTGGDRIAARFMRQDFFEFVPQFKLVIAGNHKPSLRSVDAAMRRRMHLIPFTVNIPEGERDTSLPERLRTEWGGILAWLIEGCLAWQRDGLQPPAAVRAATDEYLASEDVLGSWLDERCDLASGNWASRQELFGSWTRWAEGSREFVGTQKQFLDTMRNHQFEEGKREGVRGFRGVRLRQALPPLPPPPFPR